MLDQFFSRRPSTTVSRKQKPSQKSEKAIELKFREDIYPDDIASEGEFPYTKEFVKHKTTDESPHRIQWIQ